MNIRQEIHIAIFVVQTTYRLSPGCYKLIMKRFFTTLAAPVLGAGGVGVCPACWVGSSAMLTYLGLGALIPLWQWITVSLLGLSFIGFGLDYRSHKNPTPMLLLFLGAAILYLGRYILGGTGSGAWPIWGAGGIIIVLAIIYNKKQFVKKTRPE